MQPFNQPVEETVTDAAPTNAQPLTALEYWAAVITGKDVAALAAGPDRERTEAVHDLVFVALTCLLQFGLWLLVLLTFNTPALVALIVALLIGAIVIMIDIRMTASDTYARGVLRNGPFPRAFWAALLARLLISLSLSNVTATGVDEMVFHAEALQAMDTEREAANRPIIDDYDRQITAVHERDIGPLEHQLAELRKRVGDDLTEQATLRSGVQKAQAEAETQSLEQDRQIDGTGDRDRGNGVLARDAQRLKELAEHHSAELTTQASELQTQRAELNSGIAQLEKQVAEMRPRVDAEEKRLLTERDEHLQKRTVGPLTVLEGLLKLREDPAHRAAVFLVSILAWTGIMTLELGYFLARSVFRGASVHDLSVNTSAQRHAGDLAHGFAAHIRKIRLHQPLRVVGEDGDAAPPPPPAA